MTRPGQLGSLEPCATENLSKIRYQCGFRRPVFLNCTKSGRGLVDDLHSIDFKADRLTYFLLTVNIERVKTHSFFDSF